MFDNLRQWLRKYISPVFVAMLVASFVLWYIAKLNSLRIPLSELDYAPSPDEEGYIVIDPQSLQNAISVHYSDVKVVAVRNIPPIKLPVEE